MITDGPQDKSGLADEVGSEDDLYNEFCSSSNRFGHPGGGGGEQLAINEVEHTGCLCVTVCVHILFLCQWQDIHRSMFICMFETQGLTEPKQTVFMYKDNWFQTGFQGTTVVEYVAVLLIQCLNMLEFSHCFLIVYYPSVPLLRPETSRILPQFFPHHLQHD